MAKFDVSSLRNTALVGHSNCGKTILAESMLFNSKVVNRMGRVEDGTTVMDFEPEETKRVKSLGTACAAFDWKKHHIFLTDTPGDGNFFADTFLALEAADSAILVVEAIDGVKVQTEKAWQRASELGLPVLCFINKMDRERADLFKTVEELESILGIKPLVLQMPLGSEADFKGVVDLVAMKACIYADDASGKFETKDIPAEIEDRANELREKLIEDIAEVDDALVEKYLDEGSLNDEEILQGLTKGIHSAGFVPMLCGSATGNVGVVHLMQAVLDLLPSPLNRPAKQGVDPGTGEKVMRGPSPDEPFSALVFKTLSDPYAGKLSIFRVFSGTLSADISPLNSSRGVKERLGQIMLLQGKTQKPVDSVCPGAVAAVAKLKETRTGDTLTNDKEPVRFDIRSLPPPIIAYAIEPKTREDEDKVMSSLQRLMEEDPMLRLSREEQTRDIMIEGMGRSHLEVTVDRLRNKFGIEVNLKTPKVPYRETVKAEKTGVIYRHKKQTGGRGQFAEVHFDVSALPRGEGFQFEEALTGMNVPRNFVPAVEKGVQEALRSGPLAGYPVSDIKVRFYDGKSHEVDSSDMAFKIAASMCLKKGIEEAGPVLLEPIVTMEVIVPEENMGDIIGDLNSRRGRVLGMEDRGNAKIIKAQVPYAEVLMYEPDLTSMTSGRGSFTMEFSHYEEVPQHLTDRIVQQAKAESEGA
jgi:elongation factor G